MHFELNAHENKSNVIFYNFSAKFDEARKARVLFAVVVIFAICNLPRIVLNVEEGIRVMTSYYDTYCGMGDQHQQQLLNYTTSSGALIVTPATSSMRCYSPPFWTYIFIHISNLLLTLNASICTIVYCALCTTLRSKLLNQFRSLRKLFLSFCNVFPTNRRRTNRSTPPQVDV